MGCAPALEAKSATYDLPCLLGASGPQCGRYTQYFCPRSEHGVDSSDCDVLDDRHHFHRVLGANERCTVRGDRRTASSHLSECAALADRSGNLQLVRQSHHLRHHVAPFQKGSYRSVYCVYFTVYSLILELCSIAHSSHLRRSQYILYLSQSEYTYPLVNEYKNNGIYSDAMAKRRAIRRYRHVSANRSAGVAQRWHWAACRRC